MFRRLRLGLTALYLVAALALILLVSAGTYQLIGRYFQGATDLALQHKMAEEMRLRGMGVPAELAAANRDWYTGRGRALPQPSRVSVGEAGEEGGGRGEGDGVSQESAIEESYDGELAAIFVLPLAANGQLVDPSGETPPIPADNQALTSALERGSDWRTVNLSGGMRTRLLTYRVQSGGVAALQLGRTLGDQDRVLNQLLIILLGLGGISAVLLGAASWWLAGRSLRPAQKAWERQQAFVANASHELRAPITLMRASTEVALRGLPLRDKGERALLTDVLQECDHMSHLVEDLLLLSRLDAGRLSMEHTVIKVRDLLADVQRQVGRVAGERGIRLELTEASGAVIGDPTHLRQVLLTLLDNALRHTPRGGNVELSARPDGRYVQICVSDSGSGIPPEHLPHVFERFYRANGDRAEDGGGSGLGLSIARGLVEAQHGHITIASQPGQGTQVTLLLPGAKQA